MGLQLYAVSLSCSLTRFLWICQTPPKNYEKKVLFLWIINVLRHLSLQMQAASEAECVTVECGVSVLDQAYGYFCYTTLTASAARQLIPFRATLPPLVIPSSFVCVPWATSIHYSCLFIPVLALYGDSLFCYQPCIFTAKFQCELQTCNDIFIILAPKRAVVVTNVSFSLELATLRGRHF